MNPENPEYRTIDGFNNNLENPTWGAANTRLIRETRFAYDDGISEPSGKNKPNPRDISNVVLDQQVSTINQKGASDYLWAWGQFIDHDLDLTQAHDPVEQFNIPVPSGDPQFDPTFTGTVEFAFKRSIYDEITGTNITNPRQQINTQSSFLDGSNIYGADADRAAALRTNDGTGKLKTGPEGYLPLNTAMLPNAPSDSPNFYLAGDVRANEQILLTALHSLLVLEHNRIAHTMFGNDLSEEVIYQTARKKVIALIQVITYNEFLPILLGPISIYNGYKKDVNPGITNIFSTACYRLGHSLVSPELLRLNSDLESIPEGNLKVRDAFFDPSKLTVGGGIEPLLRGAAKQTCEAFDARAVSELRNFLFGTPGSGGLDLASLNIQRGRDHGLPGYNDVREDFGLARKTSFADISSDQETVDRLQQVYSTVDEIDVWVGGLCEDLFSGAAVGELIFMVCKQQFETIRDGDRFWYQNDMFSIEELIEIESTTLSDVIKRNTNIGDELQSNVFSA